MNTDHSIKIYTTESIINIDDYKKAESQCKLAGYIKDYESEHLEGYWIVPNESKDCRKHKARMASDVGMKRSGMETERHEPVLGNPERSGFRVLPLPLKPIIPFSHKSSIYQYF